MFIEINRTTREMRILKSILHARRSEAVACTFTRPQTSLGFNVNDNIFHASSISRRSYANDAPKMNLKYVDVSSRFSERRNLSYATESTGKKGSDTVTSKSVLRELWNKYGAVAVGTYFSVWVMTLSSIFISLDLDLFNAATFGLDPDTVVLKVCDWYEYYTGSSDLPLYVRENPKVGTFAIAFIMTKLTEPIRIISTLTLVPIIARLFGKSSVDLPSEK